ncbi:Uma2 family endonuclease [Leptolyngbya sp. PCC 6406]|uniref:Uma2 family endonuclease n=1 Tax=Leptolyngbya sp. PCC 6406 TaxID=1173264 RepID=UPI000483DEE9|nr:Uma2 family endonuclease [Leptolyngbya sp. PCC 6406]
MVAQPQTLSPAAVVYPESDGKPMAENTQQFRWIVTIKENLEILFAAQPDIFIAGDLLWYPVEGNNRLCQAPDAMVVFGRPKGDRGSYRQWQEGGIAPQVVFEVLSPCNTGTEMTRKVLFYQEYGVEEYYQYDPDRNELIGSQRMDGYLAEIPEMAGWVSPRLGIRFELGADTLNIYTPAGERFLTPVELAQQRDQERQRADQEQQRADQEQQRADQEQQRADQEQQRADQEQQRAERLAARLQELGIEPDSL